MTNVKTVDCQNGQEKVSFIGAKVQMILGEVDLESDERQIASIPRFGGPELMYD
jgi:hypothetical protein